MKENIKKAIICILSIIILTSIMIFGYAKIRNRIKGNIKSDSAVPICEVTATTPELGEDDLNPYCDVYITNYDDDGNTSGVYIEYDVNVQFANNEDVEYYWINEDGVKIGKELKGQFTTLEKAKKTYKIYFINDGTENKIANVSFSVNSKQIRESDITIAGKITPQNYGDDVDYSITTNGVTLDNWKIFYNDGTHVYLKYADYLPNACVTATGITKSGTYAVSSTESRINFINELNLTSNWDNLLIDNLKQRGAVAMGSPTLEQYVASWNGKYPNNKLYTNTYSNVNGTPQEDGLDGYYLGTSENPNSYSVNMSSTSGYNDTLYYPHTSDWNDIQGYWLSAPSSAENTGKIAVLADGYLNSPSTETGLSICPVIRLPFDVIAGKDANTEKWILDLESETLLADVVSVGDYVNYNAATGNGAGKSYTTDSSLTGYSGDTGTTFSSSDTMKWKVMSVDKDTGTVELMAEDPTANTLTLLGKTGYKNAETILNDIGAVYGYGDGAIGGRSITVEDVNKLENYTPTDIETSKTYTSGTFINDDGTEVEATTDNPVTMSYTASTSEKVQIYIISTQQPILLERHST